MEDKDELTDIQKLRQELASKTRHLPDYKVIQLCQDYGIAYEIADANNLRILMLLCAAAEMILKERSG